MTGSRPDDQALRDGAFGRVGDARVLVPRERDPLTGRLTGAGNDRPGKRRRSPDHTRTRRRFSRGVVVAGAIVGVLAVAGVAVALSSGSGHKTAIAVPSGTTTERRGATTPRTPAIGVGVPSFKMRPSGKGIQSVSYTVEGAPQPLTPYSIPFWFTCDASGCELVMGGGTSQLPLRANLVKGRIVEQAQQCPGQIYDTYDLRATKFVEVAGIRVPGAVAGTITRTGKSCAGGPAFEVVGRGATKLVSEGAVTFG